MYHGFYCVCPGTDTLSVSSYREFLVTSTKEVKFPYSIGLYVHVLYSIYIPQEGRVSSLTISLGVDLVYTNNVRLFIETVNATS